MPGFVPNGADFNGFPRATLTFLKQLTRNNDRDWFQENKPRYEADVLHPALNFVAAMEAPMKRLSDCFQVIPKRMGGSLMRVYRDTRFSKDKTPYKTNIGIHFRHIAGRDAHAPGFYIHIAPKEVFVGQGLWHPEPKVCQSIRQHIDEQADQWRKIFRRKAFRQGLSLAGESLKKPPRGFPADHPFIDDLKRKDFFVITEFAPNVIHDSNFPSIVMDQLKAGFPLMRFLCEAVDLPC